MVKLNGAEYAFSPGMTLKELVDKHNADRNKFLAFDGFAVVINSTAITSPQARERILLDNDNIFIVPILDGG